MIGGVVVGHLVGVIDEVLLGCNVATDGLYVGLSVGDIDGCMV